MGDELVNLSGFIPHLQVDLRYATRENFTGEILYTTPEALLRRPTAEKLRAVQAELNLEGLGLKIWDAYRPPSAQRRMWDLRPDPRFVAPPDRGSRHSRGTSVDVTLVALSTGEELPMGTGFDEFTPRAAHDFSDLPAEIQANRRRLRAAMEAHGFAGISSEWWHFDDMDWAAFPPVTDC
jgi:D-alanyl-D-alanine dipeptidase